MPFVGSVLREAFLLRGDLRQTSVHFQLAVPNRERVVVGRWCGALVA
jgi:hypothetical protein